MHIAWTAHLANKPQEKQDFVAALQNSKAALDRLKQLIEEKETVIERTETSVDSYSTPGWDYKQAHLNGRRAVLADIKNLLTI